MGFILGEEVVITQFGKMLSTRVKLRYEDPPGSGIFWLVLEEPETKTTFRRKESLFTEGKKDHPKLSTGGKH